MTLPGVRGPTAGLAPPRTVSGVPAAATSRTLVSLRMTVNLNAALHHRRPAERAAAEVVGADVAHHVVDPEQVLGLDPLQAADLDDAFTVLLSREPERWLLALPVPGALAPLRGPAAFNVAALEVGQAVVAAGGGVGLVPHQVSQAVQWQVFPAARPFSAPTLYEAERELGEVVLHATSILTQLDVAAGERPETPPTALLAPGYPPRAYATADRAARLLVACDAALDSDGAAITLHEADRRSRELRVVRSAARQALCAAAGWPESSDVSAAVPRSAAPGF